MNPETTSGNGATNLVQCPFHAYGCTESFPQNELMKHYFSDAHFERIINLICSQRNNHESALLDLTLNPIGTGELLTPATVALNNYSVFVEQLNDFAARIIQTSNSMDTASNSVPNINETYNPIHSLARNVIQQMDRDPNHGLDLQSHQDQRQVNGIMMNQLFGRLTDTLSAGDHANQGTEHDQDPPPANVESTVQLYANLNAILKTELDEKPVSTDGVLIWPVDKMFNKIDDAINRKHPYIDSPPFQKSMNGHRLCARIYLNGKIDPKFISFHVHLLRTTGAAFRGTIKFALVDRNSNNPLEHIIKSCSGEMTDLNDCLGFNNFIDKNMIHQEGNRYVRDDSVYFLVYIEQTNQEKYANLPANVQHALMIMQQMQ